MSHELVSRALRDLRERIPRESDPEELRELVIDINRASGPDWGATYEARGAPASSPPL